MGVDTINPRAFRAASNRVEAIPQGLWSWLGCVAGVIKERLKKNKSLS